MLSVAYLKFQKKRSSGKQRKHRAAHQADNVPRRVHDFESVVRRHESLLYHSSGNSGPVLLLSITILLILAEFRFD